MATPTYALRFLRIDNQVRVLINNAVAWTSQVVHRDPDVNFLLNLDPHLQPGDNPTIVEIYNAPLPPGDAGGNNPWHIHYLIEIKGYVSGQVHERGSSSPAGLKGKYTHKFEWPY